jgi:hypothetical protein
MMSLPVDDQDLRSLTDELAQRVLTRVAPEELDLYPETAHEYYADPQAVLNPNRRDEALGFGLELAMITPVVISVAGTVLQWLANNVVEAAIKEASPGVLSYLRGLFRRGDKDDKDDKSGRPRVALTAEQAKQVRDVAYKQALAAGLGAAQAGLIADSTAGALVTAG